jgi:CheY-like chemotaxis protein
VTPSTPQHPKPGLVSVLLAEDDADNRWVTRLMLESYGYRVVMAVDGQDAWDKLSAEPFDVCVFDLSMPRLNGWELAHRIRQHPKLKGTPLVAFTAHALQGDEKKALDAGYDAYITKPCSPETIAGTVSAWAKRKRPS